ncbi:Cytochrome P450 [Venustampulla echinocandica]|uniref:Cytochrome P450 n=1 Tax=Venustampulla echinocandica TaxID=2656787 RepID=A0A370TSC3_9HELO|nr:Cytochrome P450 [Venustampulla echinocandica]RDL38404.1 Cytochrome P450 [Venustampulla echinocandica]
MHIPIIVVLASGDNPVWILLSKPILAVFRFIFGEIDIVKYGKPGWESKDKYKMHEKLGDAVVHVSPGHNWLYICNPAAVNDIFKRKDDFDRPPELLEVLGVFGPNLSTASSPFTSGGTYKLTKWQAIGADWQRQRKITSAPFNDKNNSLVWTETLRQASEVLQFWKTAKGPITTTDIDTRTLSLHVLSGAGFGKSYSFKKSAEKAKEGHMFNYRDAISLILENCLLILVLGPRLLGKMAGWSIFGNWSRIGQATIDFKDHMTTMLIEEKSAIATGKVRSPTITNALIRASEESNAATGGGFKGLTEDEIYGNIFVYNFAGHDTTATTFNWALYLLAAFPDVQEWMAEEINAVLGDREAEDVDFRDVFPKLNRCLAVLYETLRLWNPLLGICKSTFLIPQPLTVGEKTIVVPPDTRIIPNSNAIHTHPRYWGEDSMSWKPARWILSSATSSPSSQLNAQAETFKTFPKGSYIAWSDGVRPCPGKKFSQVEFVAAMVSLFRRHRVEIVPNAGESVLEARERVKKVINDNVIVLLLQMREPKTVGLKWVEVK